MVMNNDKIKGLVALIPISLLILFVIYIQPLVIFGTLLAFLILFSSLYGVSKLYKP